MKNINSKYDLVIGQLNNRGATLQQMIWDVLSPSIITKWTSYIWTHVSKETKNFQSSRKLVEDLFGQVKALPVTKGKLNESDINK